MMIKTVLSDSYDFGAPGIQLVKASDHTPLRGDDLRGFVKRAGFQLAELAKGVELHPGEKLAHIIALGAGEFFGCFTAGTPIAMADGNYTNIEDLRIDDLVLSADGNTCPITAVFRRQVESTLKLDVSGLAETLQCSLNHPFRVARREQFGQPDIDWEWAEASTLRKGDFLIWTPPAVLPTYEAVTSSGHRLRDWIGERGRSSKKCLPPWVCCLPIAARLTLFTSFIDGDLSEYENDITLSFTDRSLSMGFQRLCWSLGIVAPRSRSLNGWDVTIPNMIRDSDKPNGFYHKGRVYLPVQIIHPSGPAEVFNFEVEGDHTYSGPNVDSHNCNRNGDSFLEDACRSHHGTFVKYARAFRNHDNKCTRKSYGIVKASAYNEEMKRIELLVALNGTKEAADRNGGLIADQELTALESGKDYPTSMSCKIAFDQCVGCQHKAKNRLEYCAGEDEGGHCKRGGVKNRMGFAHDDGFINHVINPHPNFFDISKVFRGADRISWTTGILKEAAAGRILGGAELAELLGVGLPPHMEDTIPYLGSNKLERLTEKLAAIEARYAYGGSRPDDVALSPEFETHVDFNNTDSAFEKLAALAERKVVLPVESWFKLVHGQCKWASVGMIRRHLPGIYGRMLTQGYIKEANGKLPKLKVDLQSMFTKWAFHVAPDLSIDPEQVSRRVKRAALHGYTQPRISKPMTYSMPGSDEVLARGYAFYKLAFLQSLENTPNFDRICELAIRQNYVS
jgi:hypothetical protein